MITALIPFFIIMIFLAMSNSKNPMKMSFLIMAGVSLMLLAIYMETGNSWFPLLFFILFTGGILMMFMILSSILPNEKAYKVKIPKIIFVSSLIMFPIVSYSKENFAGSNFYAMKGLISSSLFFSLMTVVILLYFFNSIKLNSSESYSMRSFQCC